MFTTSAKSNVTPIYHLGSLPKKIKHFIEASSEADAYHQRSHSHHSLLNAYMVATFLEEASQYVPPMKRDAGLRDLAQRLHLWPGDMAMQLQRDALQATELLEKYVEQTLTEELRFVERSVAQKAEDQKQRLREMTEMKEIALENLSHLKRELREQILKHHLDFASTDLELHDLSPFIPGFTSARAKGLQALAKTGSPSLSSSAAELSASFNLLGSSGLSPERIEALAIVERFRDTVKAVADEITDIIENQPMKILEGKVEKLVDIQEYFERMRNRLYLLLNGGGQKYYDRDVGSSSER